jgi:uncharacterized membrane protein YdbT with pleckstrin-like domain
MKEFELEPGEEVVIEARKSWLIFVVELLPYAIMAVLPFALPNIIRLSPYAAPIDFNSSGAHALVGIWLLVTWTSAWGTFTRYFLNAWVLTNQRIVDIKQRGFFNREVSSLFLSRVQDVTSDVQGFFFSIFGVGDINVQSAGEEERFSIHGISHPEQMRDIILKYMSTQSKSSGVE